VSRRVRFTNLVLLASLGACVPAVAPWVSGWHWTLDLLACFVVQAMVGLALAALVLAAARRWRAAMVPFSFALVAAAAVLPAWLRSPPAGAGDALAARFLSLNLERGKEDAAERALAAIRERDPDVLFCCELTPAWLRALQPGVEHLPYRFVRTDEGYFGIGLFSRWPLTQATSIPLGCDWAPAVRAIVATPAGPLGLLGVHTPRPGGARRNAERDRALAAIPDALAPLPARRVVLGDCNATPWNDAFRSLLAHTDLRSARDGGWLPTWTTDFPWPLRIPIDHVLVSDGIGVAACDAGPEFGSDHLPLSAVLRLPRQ
jgi:endonuclease/exonuclease/phosphatase (EEP) superfamily protein YafD